MSFAKRNTHLCSVESILQNPQKWALEKDTRIRIDDKSIYYLGEEMHE